MSIIVLAGYPGAEALGCIPTARATPKPSDDERSIMMTQKSGIILLLALVMCVAITAVGFTQCCKDKDQDQELTIDQLPAAVKATLLAQAQGNPIEDLEKETEDGVTFYSADIIKGDQKVGVEILEDGTLKDSELEAIKAGEDEDADDNGAVEEDDDTGQADEDEAGEVEDEDEANED